ncbi:hypothetical protein ALC57_13172, partial [Trachymyrmex cornetzi]
AVRILGRKYALTRTGYKFLEIGINVSPPSYVEIAIGDNRGNELILSLETWKGLYEQYKCIELAFDQLVGIVEKVDTKFTRFSNISSTVTDAKDIPNVICDSDYFDKN